MMKRIFSRILLGVGCLSAYACGRTVPAEHEVAVVPQPAAVECGDGTFRLTGDTPVRMVGGAESDARMEWVADALDEVVEPLFGRKLSVGTGDASIPGAVNIGRADTLPQEAYRLTVADDRIEILAGAPRGRSMPCRRSGSCCPPQHSERTGCGPWSCPRSGSTTARRWLTAG